MAQYRLRYYCWVLLGSIGEPPKTIFRFDWAMQMVRLLVAISHTS